MPIEVAHQGPVAFDSQGGAQRGHQGKAAASWLSRTSAPAAAFFYRP
jgi:hypothetical protein